MDVSYFIRSLLPSFFSLQSPPKPQVNIGDYNGGLPPTEALNTFSQPTLVKELLEDDPQKLSAALRSMHLRRDPARYGVLRALKVLLNSRTPPSLEKLRAFNSTGLVYVLLEIAADESIYTEPDSLQKTVSIFFHRHRARCSSPDFSISIVGLPEFSLSFYANSSPVIDT